MHVYFADLWATKDEIDSLRRRRSKLWQCVCRLAMERDSVERESREKETKILSVNRQLEELQDRLAESDRLRSQQQRELDSYANSQDDVGKNVCCLALSVSLVKFLTFINLFVALLVFLVSLLCLMFTWLGYKVFQLLISVCRSIVLAFARSNNVSCSV